MARPLAEELLGSPLVRIETYGSYSCRQTADSRRSSEHALPTALDVRGFRLTDAREVDLSSNWGKPTAQRRFVQ